MKTRGSARAPRGSTVYAATKHAITAVAVGLPMEVGEQSVRATSIEPGLVRTEFAGTSHGSAGDYYANLPFEPLEAEDIARAVLYAVSRPEHVSVDERSPSGRRSSRSSISAFQLVDLSALQPCGLSW